MNLAFYEVKCSIIYDSKKLLNCISLLSRTSNNIFEIVYAILYFDFEIMQANFCFVKGQRAQTPGQLDGHDLSERAIFSRAGYPSHP